MLALLGLRDLDVGLSKLNRTQLESWSTEGNTPVDEKRANPRGIPSTAGHVEFRGNPAGPPAKAKYLKRPIANKYREGKVKSTPGGE